MRRGIILEVISFLIVLLFLYAALNKLTDYQKFVVQLGQSPLLMGLGPHLAWFVLAVEFVIPVLLVVPAWRLSGFYASFVLMVMFTIYILAILHFSSHIPCSCGGVLEKLGWREHLVFNLAFVILSALGVVLETRARGGVLRGFSRAFKSMSLILVSCMIFAVVVVAMLAYLSDRVTHTKGSFLRAFRQHALDEQVDLDIGVNSYYLAGGGRTTVYLGNHVSPLHVLSVDLLTGDTTHHALHVAGIFEQKFWSVRLSVDSPDFCFYDGVVPRIYTGNVHDWKGYRLGFDSVYFQALAPIGKRSFAIRSLFGDAREAALGKLTEISPYVTFRPDILQKQVDGFFCTAGYLHYSRKLQRLVYLYRYRNQYLVMDSVLRVISRSTTLDTNSVAKVEVATIQSTKSRVFQRPPLVVNDKSCIGGNYLFVNSALLSNNESADALDAASVIDVYDLVDTRYLFSFYLFDHHTGEKLAEFTVVGSTLIALFDTRVQLYELNAAYFPDL